MKRKDFFKTLFGVTAAAVVAPSVFKPEDDDFIYQSRRVYENTPSMVRDFSSITTSLISTEMDSECWCGDSECRWCAPENELNILSK